MSHSLRDDPKFAAMFASESEAIESVVASAGERLPILEDRIIEALKAVAGGGGSGGSGRGSRGSAQSAAKHLLPGGGALTLVTLVVIAIVFVGVRFFSAAETKVLTGADQIVNSSAASDRAPLPTPAPQPAAPSNVDLKPNEAVQAKESLQRPQRARPRPANPRRPPGSTAPQARVAGKRLAAVGSPTVIGDGRERPRVSRLRQEIEAYEVALALLKVGDGKLAVPAFEGFLKAHPTSTLRPEAELALLEGLVLAGDDRRAAELAADLASRKGFPRRGDVLRLYADALAALGDCTKASFAYHDALALRARGLTEEGIEAAVAACQSQ